MLEKNTLHFITIIVIVLLTDDTKSMHVDSNNSDMFITYSGHSEVRDNAPILDIKRDKISDSKDTIHKSYLQDATEVNRGAEDVVFIPNEKPVLRNDDYLENDGVRIADVIEERNLKIGDVMRDEPVSEPANEDILFISGKNNENVEKNEKQKTKHEDAQTKTKYQTKTKQKLDCFNLDCNNTINSVCGGKVDNKKWKYRLFLNECFFRKVNCAFKYPNNRYDLVEKSKCDHIGAHTIARPMFQPILPQNDINEDTRRIYSSRRSLNVGISGLGCSHTCPITCTDKYDPQCAVNRSGHHKTFLNHCQLDRHSCSYKIEWHIRPLSECVGGRKADMRQNRGFIAWMQKVGIVDNRGRLVHS